MVDHNIPRAITSGLRLCDVLSTPSRTHLYNRKVDSPCKFDLRQSSLTAHTRELRELWKAVAKRSVRKYTTIEKNAPIANPHSDPRAKWNLTLLEVAYSPNYVSDITCLYRTVHRLPMTYKITMELSRPTWLSAHAPPLAFGDQAKR